MKSPSNQKPDLRLQPKPYHALVGVITEAGYVFTTEYADSILALNDAVQLAAVGTITVFGVVVEIERIVVSVAHVWQRGDPPQDIELKEGDPHARPN